MLCANFENGNPGLPVRAADPGGPDAWDTEISSEALATLVYDMAHARGGVLAAKCQTQATGDQIAFAGWAGKFGTQTDYYFRLYVYLTGYPPIANTLVRVMSPTRGPAFRVRTDGKLEVFTKGNVAAVVGPAALPLNQFIRLEGHVVHNGASGSVAVRVYATNVDAAAGAYDYEMSATGDFDTQATGIRFGINFSVVSVPVFWMDSIAATVAGDLSTWIGPSLSEPGRDVLPFTAWNAPVAGNATVASLSNYKYIGAEAPDRVQFVTEPASPYNALSLRVEVRQDDVDHNGHSERCEVAANPFAYAPGQEFWLSLAIYLDPTFPIVGPPYWQVIHQLYGSSGGESTGSPPFSIEIDNEQFLMTVRGGVKASGADVAPRIVHKYMAPVTRGEWHELLIHSRLAKDSTGLTEAWHRPRGGVFPATPQVTDTGVNVLTVNGVDQWVYPETGLYRASRPEVGVAFYGGLWIRDTRVGAESMFRDEGVSRLVKIDGVPKLLPS